MSPWGLAKTNVRVEGSPSWSPDGTLIAYVGTCGTEIVQITDNAITDWPIEWADVHMGD